MATGTKVQSLQNPGTIVQDGDVISSETYNLLRAAILEIAGSIGSGPTGQPVIVTVLPTFVMNKAGPAWVVEDGVVHPPGGGGADGILSLQLPNGVSLQSMTAIGRRSGAVDLFDLKLLRQPLNASVATPLITIHLDGAADPFNVKSGINITDP